MRQLALAARSYSSLRPAPAAPLPRRTVIASSPPPAASASATGQRIEVRLTDALRMEPARITVRAGQPVTFVLSNTGTIEHEFYLGDEAAQAEQEAMMQTGQMVDDTPQGIALRPGEAKELTYTFDQVGRTRAGCHIAGHYAGGMNATITVTE